MVKDNEMSFEEALVKLEVAAEALKKDTTTLEDAMSYFDEGLKHYKYCNDILSKAKQKILLYDQETKSLKEME